MSSFAFEANSTASGTKDLNTISAQRGDGKLSASSSREVLRSCRVVGHRPCLALRSFAMASENSLGGPNVPGFRKQAKTVAASVLVSARAWMLRTARSGLRRELIDSNCLRIL